MSRGRLLGYVEYDPDAISEDDEAHMFCVNCARSRTQPDDRRWAAVRDSGVYGNDVPYPECSDCSEVMRPDIILGGFR